MNDSLVPRKHGLFKKRRGRIEWHKRDDGWKGYVGDYGFKRYGIAIEREANNTFGYSVTDHIRSRAVVIASEHGFRDAKTAKREAINAFHHA